MAISSNDSLIATRTEHRGLTYAGLGGLMASSTVLLGKVGVELMLTSFEGDNQFIYAGTYAILGALAFIGAGQVRSIPCLFLCFSFGRTTKKMIWLNQSFALASSTIVVPVFFCPPVAKTTDSGTHSLLRSPAHVRFVANHNSQEQMRSVWSSLSSSVPSDVIGDLSVALSTVRKEHPEADVLVTGSLLLCGVFLQLLRDQEGIDPWA